VLNLLGYVLGIGDYRRLRHHRNVEVGSFGLVAIKTAELVLSKGPQIGVVLALELNQAVLIKKLHGQSIIVGQHWTQGLKPLDTQYDIGARKLVKCRGPGRRYCPECPRPQLHKCLYTPSIGRYLQLHRVV